MIQKPLEVNKKSHFELTGHVLFWLVPSYLMIQFKMVQFGRELSNIEAYVPFIANVIFNAVLSYFIILVLFPAYNRKQISKGQYIMSLIFLVIICTLIKLSINNLSSIYFTGHLFNNTSLKELFLLEFLIVMFFGIQSVLYCLAKDWIKNSIINRKLHEEKLSLELRYLKSQINPHFLFNTLNNLYSMALLNKDEETAKGIRRLSQIMRYMLNDSNEQGILLDDEIEYLKSYIELQKLRFTETDDIKVTFNCEGETAGIKIPPYLFIVFVENAFKYGVDYKKPSFVDVNFQIKNKVIVFDISNTVHPQDGLQKHGIGLINIKERLKLLFKDNHQLRIYQTENTYHVELEINLNNYELLYN